MFSRITVKRTLSVLFRPTLSLTLFRLFFKENEELKRVKNSIYHYIHCFIFIIAINKINC